MSDPLSVIASVAGLVQVSANILSITQQLYTSGKDAPASIRRIKDEMEDLHLIFRQVQSLIEGYENKRLKRHRLNMLPLHDLMTILTSCVLRYSELDERLSRVADLVDESGKKKLTPKPLPGSGSRSSRSWIVLKRIKWALWEEPEAAEFIADIARHKSSLHIMLTVINIKWYVGTCHCQCIDSHPGFT